MNDTVTVPRGVQVMIQVLTNDTDADGDKLTITSVTNPSKGTASHDGAQVIYQSDNGHLGQDSLTYTISDGRGGTDTAMINITVEDPNRAPTAFDDEVLGGGGSKSFNVITGAGTVNGTANPDFDPDGDPLKIDAINISLPQSNGQLTCATSGACTWTYTTGCSSFESNATYTLRDNRGGSDTAAIDLIADQAC